ncbi:dynein assembly factor 4, axonemal-like [Pomacea canaliculata]|uniref:dynein assembly factor 4, axonemal-like n=1 Tax=Pomacea canaliculata TaxID=400727 RepID=UPI000D73168D|nr:dynein assembly factor 4, axonemal-like [Pomacea canaliculata]
MRAKREEAIAKTQTRTQEAIKLREEAKRENEKAAVREMMKIEETERSRIEGQKRAERERADADLEAWKEEQRRLAELEKQRLLAERMEEEKIKRGKEKRHRRVCGGNIFYEAANEMGAAPKRLSGKIEVNFTERVFPTPVRESTAQAEEEWLQKQAEARQVAQLADSDLSEEERNPQFLRDKGNSFFATGNYQAAVNAYTHAIRLNPKMSSLYSNRAACHLKLRNFFKCIEDCSKALDLLHPPVPQNAPSRCKALVRRGTAFCELEMYVEGLGEYEAALKIEPNNEELRADAEKIRQLIQGNTEA